MILCYFNGTLKLWMVPSGNLWLVFKIGRMSVVFSATVDEADVKTEWCKMTEEFASPSGMVVVHRFFSFYWWFNGIL